MTIAHICFSETVANVTGDVQQRTGTHEGLNFLKNSIEISTMIGRDILLRLLLRSIEQN